MNVTLDLDGINWVHYRKADLSLGDLTIKLGETWRVHKGEEGHPTGTLQAKESIVRYDIEAWKASDRSQSFTAFPLDEPRHTMRVNGVWYKVIK